MVLYFLLLLSFVLIVRGALVVGDWLVTFFFGEVAGGEEVGGFPGGGLFVASRRRYDKDAPA